MKRFFSLLLSCTVLFSVFAAVSLGFEETVDTLGNCYGSETVLSPGLTYREYYAENKGTIQHAFAFFYTPGQGTSLLPAYGGGVYGTDTLAEMAALAVSGGYDVVGGLNGDFYSTKTGVPFGLLIENGTLITSDDGRNALGLDAEGRVLLGKPDMAITLRAGETELAVSHLNKYPSVYGSYLLTEEYGETTKSTTPSLEIVLDMGRASPSFSSPLEGVVTEAREGATDSSIPQGCMVLSVNQKSEAYEAFSSLAAGDAVTLTFSASEGWEQAVFAIGGSDLILKDGEIVTEAADEYHETVANPRTAVGVTADGDLVFYAVDGRNSGMSTGQRLVTLAKTMRDLGCVAALNLDGGGSTTVMARLPGQTGLSLVNRPSDGRQRRLAEGILFVNSNTRTGDPDFLALSPGEGKVLCGSAVNLSALLYDTAQKPMSSAYLAGGVTYTLLEGDATLWNQVLLIGESASRVTVRAEATVMGKQVSGLLTLDAVTALDTLRFATDKKLVVAAGESIRPELIGYSGVIPVSFDAGQISFTLVDEKGQKTENPKVSVSADGKVTVSADCEPGTVYLRADYVSLDGGLELNTTAEITVCRADEILLDFDDEPVSGRFDREFEPAVGRHQSPGVRLIGDKRYLSEGIVVPETASSLSVWVSGDFTGSPYVECVDASGTWYSLFYERERDDEAFNGWTKYRAVIPEKLKQPITLMMPFAVTGEANVVYDDVSVGFGYDKNLVFSDMAGHWAKDSVYEAYELNLLTGENREGSLFFNPSRNLTRAEFAAILARFYGLDTDLSSDEEPLELADADSIAPWALPYIRAVIRAGLMQGRANGDGTVSFAPTDTITRTEAMYVFGRCLVEAGEHKTGNVRDYLGEIRTFGNPVLNFADRDSVGEWAREYVGVTVEAGIVTGYDDGTVRGGQFISRAEVAVMMVRLYALLPRD